MTHAVPCTNPDRCDTPTTGRVSRGRRWGRAVLASLALLTLAAGTGCQTTDKQVIAQADQAHGELQKAVITDTQMADYIQNVGDRIVETAGRLHQTPFGKRFDERSKGEDRSWMFSTKTMRFHFVNSKTLNAFTTGGEHMYVYTELLRQCKDESELAAVMAHEYAHVYGRHVQSGMTRSMLATLGAGAVGVAGYAAGGEEGAKSGLSAGQTVAGVATAGYTRDDESEADHIGFDVYVRAGWAPDQFAAFFRTLLAQEKKAGGGTPEFLSDHPSTAKRVAAAEKWSADYKKEHPDWQTRVKAPVADDAQFARIKQRSVELAGTVPDDKSLQAQKLAMALPRSCMFPDEPEPVSAKQAQADLQQTAATRPAAKPAKKAKREDK